MALNKIDLVCSFILSLVCYINKLREILYHEMENLRLTLGWTIRVRKLAQGQGQEQANGSMGMTRPTFFH